MCSSWSPTYTLTPKSGAALLEIEVAKTLVDFSPLPPAQAEGMRRRTRLRSTHYFTHVKEIRSGIYITENTIQDHQIVFMGRNCTKRKNHRGVTGMRTQ